MKHMSTCTCIVYPHSQGLFPTCKLLLKVHKTHTQREVQCLSNEDTHKYTVQNETSIHWLNFPVITTQHTEYSLCLWLLSVHRTRHNSHNGVPSKVGVKVNTNTSLTKNYHHPQWENNYRSTMNSIIAPSSSSEHSNTCVVKLPFIRTQRTIIA